MESMLAHHLTLLEGSSARSVRTVGRKAAARRLAKPLLTCRLVRDTVNERPSSVHERNIKSPWLDKSDQKVIQRSTNSRVVT